MTVRVVLRPCDPITWRGSTVAVKVLDPKKINGNVVDAIKNEAGAGGHPMHATRHTTHIA